ncbi:hypothetical protein G5V59_27320 [Nocardioides sp. W3-2-3]|uniref:hypothetical protein n=1 Tax=Nocardioides convexus TaxID=2712224 RepID=UPI0024186F5B|nr:hypothetical protein [Nocardioides convexus]NHA02094.1 hypothetical protein [Nocardioides convexus]
MHDLLSTLPLIIEAEKYNPFQGVSPNFGPFTDLLQSRVGKILGLIWALAFCYLGAQLIINITKFAKAKKGKYGSDLDDVRTDLIWNGGAIVGVAMVPAIYLVFVGF